MRKHIDEMFQQGLIKLIISKPRNSSLVYRKLILKKLYKDETSFYQLECFTDKQAFHFNYIEQDAKEEVLKYLETDFRQCDAFCNGGNYIIKISKKDKVLFHYTKMQNEVAHQTHNRKKHYILEEGIIIEPLIDLGIFTKNGKVINSMYDKYKQINRYLEMIDDVLPENCSKLSIIDFGCGKSYLTFIVYYYLTVIKKIDAHMLGLDLKESVIEKCNDIARKYNYSHLRFEIGDINGYECSEPVDMVISLHACDTATDYTLYNAIKWNAEIILAVPCCQHELNKQLNTSMSIISKYGLIKERTCALWTDAIRSNLLEYMGYNSQILEFIDIAHSPKNILIRAVKNQKKEPSIKAIALSEVEELIKQYDLSPTLYNLLKPFISQLQ